jgi:hypothetical protein
VPCGSPSLGHMAPPYFLILMPLVNDSMVHVYFLVNNPTFHLFSHSNLCVATCHHIVGPRGTCTDVPCVTLPMVTHVTSWMIHVIYTEPTMPLPCQYEYVMLVSALTFCQFDLLTFSYLRKWSEYDNYRIQRLFEKVNIWPKSTR